MSQQHKPANKRRPPKLSSEGRKRLEEYTSYLEDHQDLSRDTVRNYLSDLSLFAAFCESSWDMGTEDSRPFHPSSVATPTITQYRAHLVTVVGLAPATINRHLVSIKRYFAWALDRELVARDPARVVRLVPVFPSRHANCPIGRSTRS